MRSPKCKKKVGRKPLNTGLTLRKDVVLKTVLRKIRTFYWSDFNAVTRFKLYKHRKAADYYETCIKRYVSLRMGMKCSRGYLFAFGSFMSSKEVHKLLNIKTSSLFTPLLERRNQMREDSEEVYDTLYKFSFSKYSKLVRSKDFKDLIIRYSKVVDHDTLSEDEAIGLGILVEECYK